MWQQNAAGSKEALKTIATLCGVAVSIVATEQGAGGLEALQKELERVKRSRGEYAAARVAAVQHDLEQKSQLLRDELERKHVEELKVARAEAAELRAELALQKAKNE